MIANGTSSTKIMISVLVIGLIAGVVGSWLFFQFAETRASTEEAHIRDYYEIENAVIVSPHSMRKKMSQGKNDFILVDLRSQEEYEIAHIRGAINIPAYKDKDTSDYGAVDRIVAAFRALPQDKEIITYCYSIPCMTSRKVGKILVQNEIYVKHLGIGWNEWMYDWNGWNHEHEWAITDVNDYIWRGPEAGTPIKDAPSGCPLDGSFGC